MAGDERERRRVAALSYGDGSSASRVIAKGYGDLAEQMIAEARRHGLHVHEAPELVELLMRLNLDERIPPRLYQVIAELLTWVRDLDDDKDEEDEEES